MSAAARFVPGPGDPEAADQASCVFRPGCVWVTSHPATWLSAAEKASVTCLVSGGRGHVWGQVYHLAVGEHIPGKQGD